MLNGGCFLIIFRLSKKQNGVGKDSVLSRCRTRSGSGLYVDLENLQKRGQKLVELLIDEWPESAPKPVRLMLTVKADEAELWRLWATSRFDHLDVVVKGIQHFSKSKSKNSADIVLATSAMADWIIGRVSHVAVFSDDSDFVSLYASIRDEIAQSGGNDRDVPFLWVVTNRNGTLSSTVKEFFPSDKLLVLQTNIKEGNSPSADSSPTVTVAESARNDSDDYIYTQMAQAILENVPVGSFKSTDCKGVIGRGWPDHPLATTDAAKFGSEFKTRIWPILKVHGVTIPNAGKQPIRYEMTQSAKDSALK